MTNTIHFNTGRKYTMHGQRITATLHDDGVITFFDHDRMVDGQFTLDSLSLLTFGQTAVMRFYDSHMAPGTSRSWADGLMRGGVNATFAS